MTILNRNKKAAAGVGVAALAVAAIALGGGTYAAFSDTKAGPTGTLAAGTLSLNVTTNPSGSAQLFNATDIAPGYVSPTDMTVTVTNSGTINGKLNATIGVTPSPDNALAKYLEVSGSCTAPGVSVPFNGVAVTAIPDAINGIALGAQQSATCTFKFSFPDNGKDQNDAQGESVAFTSNFTLTQA